MLLVHLISEYENKEWDLPAVHPIETIKIRMEEFGLKPSDLAKEYGNKGNLSKVLNYQRALSLTMIRQFSATGEKIFIIESKLSELNTKNKAVLNIRPIAERAIENLTNLDLFYENSSVECIYQ